MSASSSASAQTLGTVTPTQGTNGTTGQPASASAPTGAKKPEVYSVSCWTFGVGPRREGRLGIALDKAGRFDVEGKRLLVSATDPKSNFENAHIEKLGQVHHLTRCDVLKPAKKGNTPGILVLITSLVGVDLNVKCPMPDERWMAWVDAERGTDPEQKKLLKNELRKKYKDNLEIHSVGARFVVPAADDGKQVRQNFRMALIELDEGCWIELHMHTQDRGPNAMLLGCVNGKLEWRDPRVSIVKVDLQEKIG